MKYKKGISIYGVTYGFIKNEKNKLFLVNKEFNDSPLMNINYIVALTNF